MTRAIVIATILLVLLAFFALTYELANKVNPDSSTSRVLGPIPEFEPETTTTTVATTSTQKPATKKRAVRVTRSGDVYPTDELLHRLAMCETGGTMNQRATSPSGKYLSFFQWSIGTWWSVGGEGDPRDHPYEVQRDLARTLILQAGWASQFPHCSRVLGVA